MTIREHLRRAQRRLFLWALPAWLLVVFGMASERPWLAAPGFVVFFAAAISQFFIFRCPRCRGNLFLLQAHLGSTWSIMKKAQFCPFCAADLDTEINDLPWQPPS